MSPGQWSVGGGQTVLLLLASNVFMTFAWYGHLRGGLFHFPQRLKCP